MTTGNEFFNEIRLSIPKEYQHRFPDPKDDYEDTSLSSRVKEMGDCQEAMINFDFEA